jgi:hypothetical protein
VIDMTAFNTALSGILVSASLGLAGCGDGAHSNHAGHDSAGAHGDHAKHMTPASVGGADERTATTTRIELSTAPRELPSGTNATWTLQVLDAATGQPVAQFDTVHDKLMHLIVVAGDQSWFNHIHPTYEGDGRFVVETALPKAGSYVFFADYAPTGRAPEVYRHEFTTTGQTLEIEATSPAPDTVGAGGWIVRTVNAHEEGLPEAVSSEQYQIALMPMPSKLVAGKDAMLHFQVRDANGKEITDLQPYLGALGHAVILSSDSRTYLHTHPTDGAGHDHDGGASDAHQHAEPKGGGPDVVFHTKFPAAGLYKVWGQFMHRGRIVTASFVVNVGTNQA